MPDLFGHQRNHNKKQAANHAENQQKGERGGKASRYAPRFHPVNDRGKGNGKYKGAEKRRQDVSYLPSSPNEKTYGKKARRRFADKLQQAQLKSVVKHRRFYWLASLAGADDIGAADGVETGGGAVKTAFASGRAALPQNAHHPTKTNAPMTKSSKKIVGALEGAGRGGAFTAALRPFAGGTLMDGGFLFL